jgi:hypothetical protein
LSTWWNALSYLNPLPYLAMPGQYTRGILAGRPGERLEGRDLLRAWGLTGKQDDWGNFIAGLGVDFLTDPLTLAAGHLARMGMRAAAAALPVRSGLGRAGSYASGSAVAARQRFGDMMGEFGIIRNPTPLEAGAQPLAGYVAPRIVGSGTTRLQAEAVRAPRAMVEAAWQNLPPGATYAQRAQAARHAAEVYTRNTLRSLGQDAEYLNLINPQSPVEALYDQGRRVMTLTDNIPGMTPAGLRRNWRHETIHGLIDTATTPERMSRLPWPARWAANERAVGLANNDLSKISRSMILDEVAAHALENRSLMKQMQGGAAYLFHPGTNAVYSDMYRQAAQRGLFDPRVAEAYASLPQKFVEYPARAAQTAAAAVQLSQPAWRPDRATEPSMPPSVAPASVAGWPSQEFTPPRPTQADSDPGPLRSAMMQPVDNSLRPQPIMPFPDKPPMDYQQHLRQNREKRSGYNLLDSMFSQSPSFDMHGI